VARDYEFRPDREGSGNFEKLLLSQRQRFGLLRWTLFALLCVLVLLVQDAMAYRVDFFGAGTDLVPCVIIMITALQGAEAGSIFSLAASIVYYFSGSAQGPYVVPLITVIAIFAAIFRQACLRKGFFSILLSTALGMLCYELLLFGIGLFLRHTVSQWTLSTVFTALLSLAAVPVGYPIARAIGKIGGETWKE
jgi:hypothetical protein